MSKKENYLLILTLLVFFMSIFVVNAQEPPLAHNFRFPLEGDWSPLWQDFGKWNNQWNGYHLGEDVGREDADKKNYAVYPMADGVVKFADIVMGYTVIIEHKLSDDDPDGDYVCSVYYHMKRPEEGGIKLTVGESVSMDSPIGYVSSKWEDHKSSPHLHFGIRKGRYNTGKDPKTGFWYYPGYTTIKKDGEVQKNPDDPIHKQILADWFNPSTDPKNGTGFIERHIAKIEQAAEISKTTPIITSPLKITPSLPYYVGDTINAEFTITNRDSISITFSVLTVGGRDPDNQIADFTHRQNINLEPSESYNYQGTLTLNKAGNYHFFCAYQTPDGDWNTSIDLGSGLTDKDRIEDIVVKEKEKPFSNINHAPISNLTKNTYYNTIREALDDANSGNTIEVTDGTYDESITFPYNKRIILQSVNGASLTTIRGVSIEDSLEGTILEGFTITGSGISVNGGNLTIKNCTISDNTDYEGGGIENHGLLTITGSTISNNAAVCKGGGIYNHGRLTITGSTISNNYTGRKGEIYNWGGGIFNWSGSLTITGSIISNNSAGHGGGIFNYNGSLTIIGSIISDNSAEYGGGIENQASLTIIKSTISGNYGHYEGGGIDNSWSGTLILTGNTISNNSAKRGGGIYISYYPKTITIGGNSIDEKNTICGNYKSGEHPSLGQQIKDFYVRGDLYEIYKDFNNISVYCE